MAVHRRMHAVVGQLRGAMSRTKRAFQTCGVNQMDSRIACRGAGLGSEPRRVLDELSKIRMVDVVLPTRSGTTIRRRCITRPTEHQAILLDRLGFRLPEHIQVKAM